MSIPRFSQENMNQQGDQSNKPAGIINLNDQLGEQNAERSCRICLSSQDAKCALISPCNCAGSMSYVHEDCLSQWLELIIKNTKPDLSGSKAHILCELCHGKIAFLVHKQQRCRKKQQVCGQMKEKKKTFIGILALFLVNLSFFLALLAFQIKQGSIIAKNAAVLYPLIISGLVIFGLVMIISLGVLVSKFALISQHKVLHIHDNGKETGVNP